MWLTPSIWVVLGLGSLTALALVACCVHIRRYHAMVTRAQPGAAQQHVCPVLDTPRARIHLTLGDEEDIEFASVA